MQDPANGLWQLSLAQLTTVLRCPTVPAIHCSYILLIHLQTVEFLRLVQGRAGKSAFSCPCPRAGGGSGTGNGAGRGLKNPVADSRSLGWPEGAGSCHCSPALRATCGCPPHLGQELPLRSSWEQSVPH